MLVTTNSKIRPYVRHFPCHWNKEGYDVSVTVTRPVCDVGDILYRLPHVYEITIEETDIDKLCRKTTYYTMQDLYMDLVKTDLVPALKGKNVVRISKPYSLIKDKTIVSKTVHVAVLEEIELVTSMTGRDVKKQAITKEKQANKKMLDNFYLTNVDTLAKKYGLVRHQHYYTFKDKAAFNDLIYNFLENTLIKELATIGIDAKLYRKGTGQKGYYSTFLQTKDMKVLLQDEIKE